MKNLAIISGLLFSLNFFAQDYVLVWEDNFDGTSIDSSVWNVEDRVGIWNTGENKELQHYRAENVTVGEDGNGNNTLRLTAKTENFKGYEYTSGRVNTKGKFSFRYGKLEARIKVPNVANGLWPAFWTLGYTPLGWPSCGEIDILEMGHKEGITAGTQNKFLGAACHWESGNYYAGYWQNYTSPVNLNEDYHIYTLIWDETKVEAYIDNAASPFFVMNVSGADLEEYRDYTNYLIFNLAVGGSLTDILNSSGITATLPATMYIDYVKIYQEAGTGDLVDSSDVIFGTFGVYEETVSTSMGMKIGYDGEIQTSGLSQHVGETPKEGSEAFSFNATAGNPFSLEVNALVNRNMEKYVNGSIQFWIKTTETDSLQVGISDWNGGEAFITLKEGSNLNPARNGEWAFAWIPVKQLTGVNLQKIKGMLVIKSEFSSNKTISIDKVTWEETEPAVGYYGVYSNNPVLTNKLVIDDVTGHIFSWDGTVVFNTVYPAWEGAEVLSLNSPGVNGWYGFGIFSDNPVNLEAYANGYLNLMLRTDSKKDFWVGVAGANSTEARIDFKDGSDPYGFVRDGKWHAVQIPVSDMTSKGLDLSGSGNIFMLGGGSIERIAVDEIYFAETSVLLENSAVCYPVSLTVSPATAKINNIQQLKLTASAKNQFNNKADAYVEWSSNGGNIDETGLFSSATAGVFTVTASLGELSATSTITVEELSSLNQSGIQKTGVFPNPGKGIFSVSGFENKVTVKVTSITGNVVYNQVLTVDERVDISHLPSGIYIFTIANDRETQLIKVIKE